MEIYEYTELYYGTPCQVRFYDISRDEMIGGIAYHDFIICGSTGNILPIEKVIAAAVSTGMHWDDAVVELDWLDLGYIIWK